jgi:hypothetical protein
MLRQLSLHGCAIVTSTSGTMRREGGVEVQIPTRARGFLFSAMSRPILGATLHFIHWLPGLFSGIQRLTYDGDNSAPSSAEMKDLWGLSPPQE